MVKNYAYEKLEENMFVVLERPTTHKVAFYDTKEDAKETVRQYNGGIGFNGWTPGFILPIKRMVRSKA